MKGFFAPTIAFIWMLVLVALLLPDHWLTLTRQQELIGYGVLAVGVILFIATWKAKPSNEL